MDKIFCILGAIVSLILIFSMSVLILKLTPKKDIKFEHIEKDDVNLLLSDENLKVFKNVNIIKNDKGKITGLEFIPEEETKFVYLTIFYRIKKNIKTFKVLLNFQKERRITLKFNKQFTDISFFINQFNDDVYKEPLNNRIMKRTLIFYVLLTWLFVLTFFTSCLVYIYLRYFNQVLDYQYHYYFYIIVGVTAGLCVILLPIISIAMNWKFEKYINGGIYNYDRN